MNLKSKISEAIKMLNENEDKPAQYPLEEHLKELLALDLELSLESFESTHVDNQSKQKTDKIPLNTRELNSSIWYMASCTAEDRTALINNGVFEFVTSSWDDSLTLVKYCTFSHGHVMRLTKEELQDTLEDKPLLREIYRVEDRFYWK